MTLQPFRVAPVQPWISPDGVLVPLLTTHLDAFGLPKTMFSWTAALDVARLFQPRRLLHMYQINYTSANSCWTFEQLAPPSSLPHTTTDPSGNTAANALSVAWICWTLLSWSWTDELSPPFQWWPQVTTDPSAKIAANAHAVAWICWTLLSWSWTDELSPPWARWPQVTTDPSAKIAANELSVAWICWTLLSWFWTDELSPPWARSPQVTTDPSAKNRCECTRRGLNLLHTPKLILDPRTVPTTLWLAPRNNWSIC